MLKNNFQYKDNYMFFKFNGIHSSQYNVMIQNDINDLKIVVNENASIDYVSPKYQNGRYVMGVTRSHRQLPHKLVAYGLTRAEANQVAAWLAPGIVGALIYDYALDWQYNVIVSKLGDMILYPIDTKHFVVSFDIEFNTIEGTDAQSTQDAVIMLDINDIATSESNTKECYYGVNNTKLIPSIACYRNCSPSTIQPITVQDQPRSDEDEDETEDETKYQCVIPLYVHHIGSGYTKLNISANVGHDSVQCSIVDNMSSNEAHISYEVDNDSVLRQPKIIDYKSKNHLFFINNEMPETKESRSEIKHLKIVYSSDSLTVKAPGALKLCGNGQSITTEDIEALVATPYSWFFYGTNDENNNNTEFYHSYSINNSIFPLQASGDFYYDVDYITTTAQEALQNALSNYSYVYFGFYNIITISCSPLQDITITATQFNNLLLEDN